MTQPLPSTSRDSVYLTEILKSARLVQTYTEALDGTGFQNDMKTQDAVLYRITLIGEAVRRISEPFKSDHPELPWREMLGMRNLVVHEYTRVRLSRVWEVASRDLPILMAQIEPLIPPPDDGTSEIT